MIVLRLRIRLHLTIKNIVNILVKATLRIRLFVFKMEELGDGEFEWRRIHLEDKVEKVLTQKPISIAPQMFNDGRVLFLVEPKGIAKDHAVCLIDFDGHAPFCTELFRYPLDENFRQAYLRKR